MADLTDEQIALLLYCSEDMLPTPRAFVRALISEVQRLRTHHVPVLGEADYKALQWLRGQALNGHFAEPTEQADARIRSARLIDALTKMQPARATFDVPSEKLTLNTSDPETKAVWDTVLRAKEEVASWPPWKRGEPSTPPTKQE